MQTNTVVLGAGRLGLGMIVPTLIAAGCEPTLLIGDRPSRSSSSAEVESILATNQSYLLHWPTSGPETTSLFKVACPIVRRQEYRSEGDGPSLIVLSIGPHLDHATKEYLRELIQDRLRHGPVLVFPCENRIGGGYEEALREFEGQGAFVVPCVLDRMCFTRQVVSHELVYVSVERFSGSWIMGVGSEEIDGLLRTIFKEPEDLGVSFVEDIEPYEARKARIINGSHFALALKMGCQRPPPKYQRIDEFLNHCPGIRKMIECIHVAYIQSLLDEYPSDFSHDDLDAYAKGFTKRLANEMGDSPSRILRRLTQDDLMEWINSYYERVHQPLRRYDPDLAKDVADSLFDTLNQRDLGRTLLWKVLEQMEDNESDKAGPEGADPKDQSPE